MNRLEIKGLSKTYRNGQKALEEVNLTITNGMFGLLGPNGAGKSTLMRSIATLQTPSSGSIHLNGIDINSQPDFMRRRLGYLPQEFGVYPKISAERLLDHIATLKGIIDQSKRRDQINLLLEQTNLLKHRKKAVSTFSGGMLQRFGVAQALLGNPQVVIVDEPTAGLDPLERNRFLNLLSEIGENVIVILSTHIVEDVRDLCSQIAILSEGKIILEGAPQQLKSRLNHKIWQKVIAKSQLPFYYAHYKVISTRLHSGKIQVQILSDSAPGNGFVSVTPDFESLYFSTISNQDNA